MTATVQPALGLVTLAEQILDGVVPVPGVRAPRAAAVVARQALEEEVTARCADLATFVQRPRMRSRLILPGMTIPRSAGSLRSRGMG